MIAISYEFLMTAITAAWCLARVAVWSKTKQVNWKREGKLLLVYICLIVVVRVTFFPFSRVDGRVQPLLFDAGRCWPFRINLLPLVYLMDYPVFREAMLNLIGNITMFIPLGVVWPAVFKELDTHRKVIAAGVGVSLCIEILQLPFFDRVSDIDDLLLNSLGFVLGYGLYLLFRRKRK